jgi:hypothetical protein
MRNRGKSSLKMISGIEMGLRYVRCRVLDTDLAERALSVSVTRREVGKCRL